MSPGLKSPGLKYPATQLKAQESDDFIGHCQINHPQAENFLCNEFERDLGGLHLVQGS